MNLWIGLWSKAMEATWLDTVENLQFQFSSQHYQEDKRALPRKES